MTPADYDSFAEVVAGFAELKGKQLSPPAIELYWRAMQHWSIADFRAAAEHLLRTCQFMPVPADFERLRQAGRPTAGEAWADVLDHCKGAYRYVSGIDEGGPIDQAVAALGGYRAVAMHNSEFLHVLERRFAEHFATGVDVADVRAAVPNIASDARLRIRAGDTQELIEGAGQSSVPERAS